jgi:hypothetical protein
VQTYSSTRSLCSTERSSTPTDQYLEDVHFVRAHHYQYSIPFPIGFFFPMIQCGVCGVFVWSMFFFFDGGAVIVAFGLLWLLVCFPGQLCL